MSSCPDSTTSPRSLSIATHKANSDFSHCEPRTVGSYQNPLSAWFTGAWLAVTSLPFCCPSSLAIAPSPNRVTFPDPARTPAACCRPLLSAPCREEEAGFGAEGAARLAKGMRKPLAAGRSRLSCPHRRSQSPCTTLTCPLWWLTWSFTACTSASVRSEPTCLSREIVFFSLYYF